MISFFKRGKKQFFLFHLAANRYSLGHLLITGYLSKDVVASWCSSIAFTNLIADNQQYKEAILKVVPAVDQTETTLMENN